MFNLIKFKIVNIYGNYSNDKEYYEIKCEPSYDDVILICNKKHITFEETINLLLHTIKKINILGAVSLIYYEYSNEFLEYLKHCSYNEYKKIKRKCKKKIASLNKFIERADDTLYPQNVNIRKIYQLFESKKGLDNL